ncbi:Afadin/alpha-actinin-binding protein [Striga asiatica]|uniref:Afadin/alpha-actinin-binding protein n=1 Tax=Striga asiatica TaxID=4170 RepID=A0A5A7Q672_STRAF|nr:Afadin/alpha-actinin-binding protein [Striga asiatica]
MSHLINKGCLATTKPWSYEINSLNQLNREGAPEIYVLPKNGRRRSTDNGGRSTDDGRSKEVTQARGQQTVDGPEKVRRRREGCDGAPGLRSTEGREVARTMRSCVDGEGFWRNQY